LNSLFNEAAERTGEAGEVPLAEPELITLHCPTPKLPLKFVIDAG
jgi:hypothetical protein